LAVGSTLKDIDIYGVDRDGRRVLAQCKNDAKTRKARTVNDWIDTLTAGSEDKLYFFARGGVKGRVNDERCTVVDGNDILAWLRSQKDYERYLKCL
jgi:phage host-nuclease inhibitor protein Gam